MNVALAEVRNARQHLRSALSVLDDRRELPAEAETLREMCGNLAVMLETWGVERDRWT